MKKVFNLILTLSVLAMAVTACKTGGGGADGSSGIDLLMPEGGTEVGNPPEGPGDVLSAGGEPTLPSTISVKGFVPRMGDLSFPNGEINLPNACAGNKVIATNVETNVSVTTYVNPNTCEFTFPGLQPGKWMFDIEFADGARASLVFGDNNVSHVRFGAGPEYNLLTLYATMENGEWVFRTPMGTSEGTGGPVAEAGDGEEEQAAPGVDVGAEENANAEETINPFESQGIQAGEAEQGEEKMMIKADKVLILKNMYEIQDAIEKPVDIEQQLH